jgi:hypothetical protein
MAYPKKITQCFEILIRQPELKKRGRRIGANLRRPFGNVTEVLTKRAVGVGEERIRGR